MSSATRQADGDLRDSSLLSIAAVAKRCGVSTRAVYRWINSEGLPVHRLPGTGARPITRIASSDLDQWLDGHRHDFAEEKNDDRKLQLDGRRFFKTETSDARTGKRLDTPRAPGSRVPAKREAV